MQFFVGPSIIRILLVLTLVNITFSLFYFISLRKG